MNIRRHFVQATSIESALLLIICVMGCNRTDPSAGNVQGIVSLDGKPLPFGGILFVSDDGKLAKGVIGNDGTYRLKASDGNEYISVGTYRVKVQSRPLPAGGDAGGPATPGKSIIPEKYERIESSGLQFDIVPGSNQIDIPLSSKSSS